MQAVIFGVFRICFSITWPHSVGTLPVKNMSTVITGNFFIKKNQQFAQRV